MLFFCKYLIYFAVHLEIKIIDFKWVKIIYAVLDILR